MKQPIGTQVYIDGTSIGKVIYLIVDPRSRELTHIIVKRANFANAKIISLTAIEINTKRAIILYDDTRWDDLPNFQAEYYEPADGDSYVLMPKVVLHPLYYYPHIEQHRLTDTAQSIAYVLSKEIVHKGMYVFDKNEQQFAEVISRGENADGQLTHVIIKINNGDKREIHVPISWISHLKEKNLYLKINQNKFAS